MGGSSSQNEKKNVGLLSNETFTAERPRRRWEDNIRKYFK